MTGTTSSGRVARVPGPVGFGQLYEIRISFQEGLGISLFIKQFLKLPNHAQIAVVQYGDLNRHLIGHGRGHLLNVHLDAAVAGNVDDHPIRTGDLGPDGRRETVAHNPQPAGSDKGMGRSK